MHKTYTIFAFIWTCLVIALSLVDLSDVKTESIAIPHKDKIVHFVFYSVLTFLWSMAFKPSNKRKFSQQLLVVVVCILLGMIIEVLQGYAGFNRSFEWLDIITNTIGAIFGYLICMKIRNFKPRNS